MSAGDVIGGIELEVVRRGAGRPVLLLHGAQTVDPRAPFLEMLGRHAEIIAPSHPGFGRSARPADFETGHEHRLLHRQADGDRLDMLDLHGSSLPADIGLAVVEYRRVQVQVGAGTVLYRVLRSGEYQGEVDTPSIALRRRTDRRPRDASRRF